MEQHHLTVRGRAPWRRVDPRAGSAQPSHHHVAATMEVGSGEICSASTSQPTCPSQCCWCVELSTCADAWEDCQIPPSTFPWGMLFAVVISVSILACVCYFMQRPEKQAIAPSAADIGRAYESYGDGLDDSDAAVRDVPDTPTWSTPASSSSSRHPERAGLLNDGL